MEPSVLDLPSLVLDYNHRPIYTTNVRDSLGTILSGKGCSILDRNRVIRSVNFSMPVPNVIICFNGTSITTAKFTKLNVLYRDDLTCQYCGRRLSVDKLNIDHIVPKSKFNEFLRESRLHVKYFRSVGVNKIPKTLNSWFNCVATCLRCNNKKGNRFLWDTSFVLLRPPFIPTYTPKIVISTNYAIKQEWITYLSKFNNTQYVKLIDN